MCFEGFHQPRVGAWWLGIAVLFPFGANAQTSRVIQTANSTDYAIGAQGAHYRVWEKVVPSITNQLGQVLFRTNSFTELATGLNHLVNGRWMPSTENIEITAEGGVATNGQHQVGFAANINVSNAVEIITPDGKDLRRSISWGLVITIALIGSNVLFAELQDTTGQVVSNNQVV